MLKIQEEEEKERRIISVILAKLLRKKEREKGPMSKEIAFKSRIRVYAENQTRDLSVRR